MANTSETSSVPPSDLPHTGGSPWLGPETFLLGGLIIALIGAWAWLKGSTREGK